MKWRRILASALVVVMFLGYGGLPVVAATARLLAPKGDSTVSGSVEVSVGFESSASQPVTAAALHVDGTLYASKAVEAGQDRGVISFLWDSTRFTDGAHGLSVYLYSKDKLVGKSYTKVRVRNSGDSSPGLPAPTPPRASDPIRFLNLRDGERVSGIKVINIASDRSLGESPFIAIYVDRTLKYISNRQPFSYELDTQKLTEGTHLVEAEARNSNQEVLARTAARINVERGPALVREVAGLTRSAQPEAPARITMPPAVPIPAAPAPEQKGSSARAAAARAPEVAVSRPVRPEPAPVMRSPAPEKTSSQPASAARTVIEPSEPVSSAAVDIASREPVLNPANPAVAAATGTVPAVPSVPVVEIQPDASAPDAAPATAGSPQWTGRQPEPVRTVQSFEPAPPVPAQPAQAAAAPKSSPEPVSSPPADPQAVNTPAIAPVREPAQPVVMALADVPPRLPVPTAPPDEDSAQKVATVQPEASVQEAGPAGPSPFVQAPAIARSTSGQQLAEPAAPVMQVTQEEPVGSVPQERLSEPPFVKMAAAPAWKETLPAMRPTLPVPETRRVSIRSFTEQKPLIQEGASLVHLRHVVEGLGGRVSYDHATKTASASLDGRELTADLKSGTIRIGGQVYPGEAMLVRDRAILPAGALAKAFGLTVRWDSRSRCVAFSRSVVPADTVEG
ncbi:MAG: hypothetical protein KatS3mg024_0045 [Armatimonadota bacterium]|nr:MAG: hypothetical protein KatS3mg024_0045 [Armatimonadota bacterium]